LRAGCLAAAALLAASTPALAQAAPVEGPSLLPMVLALVFVLALVPVAMWMLKRIGGAGPGSVAGMRVVAQLPLGPRERIVVVEAGERWLLLGVTAASINRIGTMPRGELPVAPANGTFAALLAKVNK
jgi:flagellar protein FliO/FliZ